MIRELITKLRQTFSERSHSARKPHNLPIKISFDAEHSTGRLSSPSEKLFIAGETTDISSSGIGFVVSSIRIKEYYLVGQDRVLNAEIDLPGGKIKMKVIGRRYEKVGIHLSTERFLIGAEIVDMLHADRERYEHFLRYGRRRGKSAEPSFEASPR
ncbi:hypothetical protein [Leptolyngbya sp. 7M]|uniref:hypothetical protein n=1 Tax=Leptolyngbya sp. 7M TaxID=2812896 RepID=UPI001B8CB7F2|nr:hypothetical protein [Leptolyngbya sp. 7M]QYO65768.1 hypothetical protein JVX88_02950 [Leptolyngbya sp. 7M]